MKYKVVKEIKKKGYPTSSRHYKTAHEAADKVEKKKYPKGYKKIKKIDDSLVKNELAGTHTKSGKITISSKVPPKLRQEVATHEFIEWEHDHGRCKQCRKTYQSHKT